MRIVIATLCLLLLLPGAARAQELIDEAAAALQADPIFVHPQAETQIDMIEAQSLRERIRAADAGPMYIAVLPGRVADEAGGSETAALQALFERTRRDGTYVLVANRTLRAGSNVLPDGVAARLSREAVERRKASGLLAILDQFVGDVGAVRRGESSGGAARDGGGGGGSGIGLLPVLAVVAVGFLMLSAVRKRRRRREEEAEMAEVRREVQGDLLALADDIRALDLDVEMPGASPEGKEQYALAVAAYDRADDALDRARAPEDLAPVAEALEEGRFAMASAKALLAGHAAPERTPPCFFDPRHGPSSREVEWAPGGGVPRPVPACEADAQRVERGEDPSYREIEVGGMRRPYWDAPRAYAPYAGGFFGGMGGGLFPGLLVGTMLGGAMFPGAGYADSGGGGGDSGGGDFGSFGGGDFGGGGGFGGGDFGGGGDIGGGDF